MKTVKISILSIVVIFAALAFVYQQKPTLYLIGDSTTHNADKETWGWGSIIPDYFDLSMISVKNHAQVR